MIQTVINRDTSFRWSPHLLPRLDVAPPSLRLVSGGFDVSIALSAKRDEVSVVQVADRSRLEVAAVDSAEWAGLVGDIGGDAFLYFKGLGQFAVRVSHYDPAGPHLHLAEPLPHSIPQGVEGVIISNVYTCVIPAGALGVDVERGGFYEITYHYDPDPAGTNLGAGEIKTERGRLRVVQAPFNTGLTARELKTLVPQLEQTRPANRDGWQPMIDMVPILDLVEGVLPDSVFADQTLGSQWRTAHAYKAAEMIALTGYAPNLDPDRMATLADAEFDRQARRLHFIDADDDGAIDAAPAAPAVGLVGLAVSNSAAITADYDTDLTRKRYTLNQSDER